MAGSIACALLISACGSTAPGADNAAITASAPLGSNLGLAEAARNQATPVNTEAQGNACRTQDGHAATHRLKAIGTEPFWAAEVDGRCVTYSTPEDQSGTRVWTRVTGTTPDVIWTGALRGKEFQLTVRPKADCSDGMSDKVYPLEAVLRVDGETRHGCAERL